MYTIFHPTINSAIWFSIGSVFIAPSTVINVKTLLFERIVDRGCVLCFF